MIAQPEIDMTRIKQPLELLWIQQGEALLHFFYFNGRWRTLCEMSSKLTGGFWQDYTEPFALPYVHMWIRHKARSATQYRLETDYSGCPQPKTREMFNLLDECHTDEYTALQAAICT